MINPSNNLLTSPSLNRKDSVQANKYAIDKSPQYLKKDSDSNTSKKMAEEEKAKYLKKSRIYFGLGTLIGLIIPTGVLFSNWYIKLLKEDPPMPKIMDKFKFVISLSLPAILSIIGIGFLGMSDLYKKDAHNCSNKRRKN